MRLERHAEALQDREEQCDWRRIRPEAYLARGGSYHQLGLHEKGLADRSKAIELDPQLPEAWFARGSAYYLLGDYAKAESDIAAVAALASGLSGGRRGFGQNGRTFEGSQERAPPAEERPRLPPPPVPSEPPAPQPKPVAAPVPEAHAPAPIQKPRRLCTAQEHETRGRALTQAGKYPEALAELTSAIQLAPGLATAYNARGYVYLLKRDYQHALADFNDAIRLRPDYPNAFQNRAIALKALDKPGR